MSTSTAITLGALVALLGSALIILSILCRFVSSDLDGFRKWLDAAPEATA